MALRWLAKICGLCLIFLLAACSKTEVSVVKPDDVAQGRIGVMTGSTGEAIVGQRFPEAQQSSFDDIMDAVTALKTGQIDAVVTAFPTALQVVKKNSELTLLDPPLANEDSAIALKKGQAALLAQLNTIIEKFKQDGTLADLQTRWFKRDLSPYVELDREWPVSGEPIRVGVSATREPMSFVDQNGRVTGHDGELARLIGAQLGRPIEFHDMKFMALIPALQSGKVDLIITGMTATDERRKVVDFTQTYFANAQVMLVRQSKDLPSKVINDSASITQLGQLAAQRIAVLPGSAGDLAARRTFPSASFQVFTVAADAALAVRTGKADAFIYDKSVLINLQEKSPGLTILTEPVAKLEIAAAVAKKKPELQQAVSRFFNELDAKGELAQLRNKWIASRYTEPPAIDVPEPDAVAGVLRVGTSAEIEPFSFYVDGRLAGLDIELARRLGLYLGMRVEFLDMTFDSLIPALQSGKIDIALSNFNVTEERKAQVLFSRAYVENDIAALVRAGTSSQTHESESLPQSLPGDLRGRRVAVLVGSAHEIYAAKSYPGAEVLKYQTVADVALAVRSGKADFGLFDAEPLRELMRRDSALMTVGEPLFHFDVAAAFNKENHGLKQAFDAYLAEMRSSGVYEDMIERWIHEAETQPIVLPAVASTEFLTVGVPDVGLPFVALQDGELIGLDIELVQRFAVSQGKTLRLLNVDFGSLIAAVVSGRVDMVIGSLYVTEERAQNVEFSDPYFRMDTLLFARKDAFTAPADSASQPSAAGPVLPAFVQGVVNSFNSNILQERRYLLLWSGLKTTMIIAICAILVGTVLGAVICFLRMSPLVILNLPAKIYISVLRGTPVLVVLMLIFYVVFASVDIDPVFVAVIAFGLNFAAYAAEIFRSGIQGIDKGQIEAGIGMGFSRFLTFIYIVLPQTVQRILPVYKGECISLVKMTSIVGYIAVQDLTKASDIIRSRTFDAFFPLVMVALLYFLISFILIQFLEYLERKTDYKRRRRQRVKS